MSTKSTIALHSKADTPATFHLYSCAFSDMVSLDIDFRFYSNTTIHLPLAFVLEMADKLQEHVKPIRELMACSEAQLKVRARASAIRYADSSLSEELLFEEEFSRLKALQEQYKKAVEHG